MVTPAPNASTDPATSAAPVITLVNHPPPPRTEVINISESPPRSSTTCASRRGSDSASAQSIGADSEEGTRLRSLLTQKRRNRVRFFNSKDGVLIRLHLQPHPQRHTSQSKHCALCGSGVGRHRSKFMCATCGVHLCVRVQKEEILSCWSKWHEWKKLEEVPSVSTTPKKSWKRALVADRLSSPQPQTPPPPPPQPTPQPQPTLHPQLHPQFLQTEAGHDHQQPIKTESTPVPQTSPKRQKPVSTSPAAEALVSLNNVRGPQPHPRHQHCGHVQQATTGPTPVLSTQPKRQRTVAASPVAEAPISNDDVDRPNPNPHPHPHTHPHRTGQATTESSLIQPTQPKIQKTVPASSSAEATTPGDDGDKS